MHSQIFKPRKAHIKLHYVVTVPPGSVVVQSLSRVWLFETPWTAACQTSLSFTISRSLLGDSYPLSQWCCLTISSSTALFSFCLQYFPASRSFPMSWLFTSGQSIGASASALVLSMNIQSWFPLGLTGLISAVQGTLKSLLQRQKLKASILWHSDFFMVHLSHPYKTTGKII